VPLRPQYRVTHVVKIFQVASLTTIRPQTQDRKNYLFQDPLSRHSFYAIALTSGTLAGNHRKDALFRDEFHSVKKLTCVRMVLMPEPIELKPARSIQSVPAMRHYGYSPAV
jgi:hypothetical protein